MVSDTAMGRIRLARLPDASALAIADFLEHNVEPGSVLLSDDWASYGPALDELEARGILYEHRPTSLRATGERAHRVHPHVHRVAALVKRWMLGTHQGAAWGDQRRPLLVWQASALSSAAMVAAPAWSMP